MNFDVIVVGVGSMGSAACYHLARRGANVLGLDRFDIPHAHGSHHGHSRMIRQAYYEHPDYVPLLRRAYALWDELQALRAEPFFHRTGGIYLGAEDGCIVAGSRSAADMHGLDYQMLTAQAAAERFPALRPDPGHAAFFERDAGFLVPELAVSAHAQGARSHGATLRTGEALVSWTAHDDRVEVVTDRATYTADHLVLASGAWSAEVAAGLGIPLQITRQVLAWFEPLGDPRRLAPENFPCWFVETEPPFGHYGFPLQPGDPGLKIAQHRPGTPLAPGEPAADPNKQETDALRDVLDAYFPGCAGELRQAAVCRYTNSPDSHFIVGAHPQFARRVSVACGFSGHGFKFSSVIGEILADLVLDGATAHPAGFLSPRRFAERKERA